MIKYISILFLLILLYGCTPKVKPIVAQTPITDSILVIDTTKIVKQQPVIIEVEKTIKQKLSLKLDSQLYIREITSNRSPEIDKFNKSVGAPVGSKWCASFVSYNLTYFKIPNPNSAWSPSFSKPEDIIWKPKLKTNIKPDTADVVSYYNTNLKRVYHIGLFGYFDKNNIPITYEGNTSGGFGGIDNDGDGVYKKKRDLEKMYAISRYIKKK
jgi:hypothetical protein